MKKFKTFLGLAATFAMTTATAFAQPGAAYTLTVPFSPGGASDSYARIVGKELSSELGVPFIIENKPGAGGSVAATSFAALPKNTKNLFLGTISTHAINPYLYGNLKYDPNKDFTPVAMVLSLPNMLAVNPRTPVRNVQDLVELGKKKVLSFGSAGTGSSAHLSSEVMVMTSGMKATHIPYRGASPANTDLMGGQIDFVFDNISSVLPLVQGGKLRALAVTDLKRSDFAPEVPTMEEAGFKGYQVISWFGFWLPKDSDPAMVKEINRALAKIYAKPEFQKAIKQVGADPVLKTDQEFTSFVLSEQKRWSALIKKLDLKI